MNTKTFLLLAVLVSMLGTSCSRSPGDQIERVLERCADISNEVPATPDPAAHAGFVADAFQAVDTSGCQEDFRVAFQEHVNAWRHAQGAYAANTLGANILEGVMAGVTENPWMIGQTASSADQATQYINATYYQLTVIAAAHGARIPRSVVE